MVLGGMFRKRRKSRAGAPDKKIREYHFVDTHRLDAYADQISSPVILDKSPEWNVELSLLGPKVSGKQPVQGRARTGHEKLQLFEEYLSSNDLISAELPYFHSESEFYSARVEAYCGIVERGSEKLKIWVSKVNSGKLDQSTDSHWPTRVLILIEDFRGDDVRQTRHSGYSALRLLISELSWLAETSLNFVPERMKSELDVEERLAFAPLETLKRLGVKFTPARRISVVYRLRAFCVNVGGGDRMHTVIGYPIAIWS